ncbi:MAG: acylphosphatase [Lentisphaerae bacterium]|nr:acylphosphatase [Lentisphaerota bacterium]
MADSRCGNFFVSGRVQGVGFRWACRDEAMRLGVTGWVRNLSDGRVEVTAEGTKATLKRFRAWLAHGPLGARVEAVTEDYPEREARHDAFEILY